jgi:hypothetical protein
VAYQVSNDMGEINNTNESHRKHGREVTNQNHNFTKHPKIVLHREKIIETMEWK